MKEDKIAVNDAAEVTACCFSSEAAGGANRTVGQSQPNHPLLCDASGLGGHTRYTLPQKGLNTWGAAGVFLFLSLFISFFFFFMSKQPHTYYTQWLTSQTKWWLSRWWCYSKGLKSKTLENPMKGNQSKIKLTLTMVGSKLMSLQLLLLSLSLVFLSNYKICHSYILSQTVNLIRLLKYSF